MCKYIYIHKYVYIYVYMRVWRTTLKINCCTQRQIFKNPRAFRQFIFNVLQCVATCCNVLQCFAVCCSVFQCVAIF